MIKTINDINFKFDELVTFLIDNDFDIYNLGGTFNSKYVAGDVSSLTNETYLLISDNDAFPTSPPKLFMNSLANTEEELQLKLFKNN